MKQENDKSIGLNQRIPFSVLNAGMLTFLETNQVNRDELLGLMLEETKGENRAKKASAFASKIIEMENSVIDGIKKHFTPQSWVRLSEREKKVLLLSLTCLRYPIVYDSLQILGTQFKIQSSVNRAFINQKLSLKYGSNRTCMVGIDALIPMIIESTLVERIKTGLYGKGDLVIPQHQFVKEAWTKMELILSKTRTISVEELSHRAIISFVDISNIAKNEPYILTVSQDQPSNLWVG
jgi:hypothetical protein